MPLVVPPSFARLPSRAAALGALEASQLSIDGAITLHNDASPPYTLIPSTLRYTHLPPVLFVAPSHVSQYLVLSSSILVYTQRLDLLRSSDPLLCHVSAPLPFTLPPTPVLVLTPSYQIHPGVPAVVAGRTSGGAQPLQDAASAGEGAEGE